MAVCVEHDGVPVAFLALGNRPPQSEVANAAVEGEWLTDAVSAAAGAPHNRLWVHLWVTMTAEGDTDPASRSALRYAFDALPDVDHVFACCDGPSTRELPQGACLFEQVSVFGDTELHVCSRRDVLPKLSVRPARVEDHDDIAPQLAAAAVAAGAEAFGAAEVASSADDEPFVLARIIEDPAQIVLVGCNSMERGVSEGLVALTAMSDDDINALAELFDLEAYDGLCDTRTVPLPQEEFDAAIEAERQTRVAAKAAEEEAARPKAEEEAAAVGAASNPAKVEEEEQAEGEGPQEEHEPEHEEQPDEPIVVETTAEEMRPSAFRLWLYSLTDGYASRGVDFLPEMFARMPEATYGVVTMPREAEVSRLVRSFFTRVPPRPGASPDFALYIVHRHALLPNFCARLGAEGDADAVAALVSDFPDGEALVASFVEKAKADQAIAAECDGQLVGFITAKERMPAATLGAAFDLRALVDVPRHQQLAHVMLDQVVLNPVFALRRRFLLGEAMELLGASALYMSVAPGEPLPDVAAEDMVQAAPVRAAQPDSASSDLAARMAFSLFVATSRLLRSQRPVSNARVVVVGASDTAMACLASLLLSRRLAHVDVTVVSAGNVATDANPTSYEFGAALLARYGVEGQVTVVDGDVVSLDVESRQLVLDWITLPYEYLVLAPALTDTTAVEYGIDHKRGVLAADGVPGLLSFAEHAKAAAMALAADSRAAAEETAALASRSDALASEAKQARETANAVIKEKEEATMAAPPAPEGKEEEGEPVTEPVLAEVAAAEAAEAASLEAIEAHTSSQLRAAEAQSKAASAAAAAQWQPESAENVVVCGEALAPHAAAQTLLAAGVRGEALTVAVPPGRGLGDAHVEAMITEAAEASGMTVRLDTSISEVHAPEDAVTAVTMERAIVDGQAASQTSCSLLVLAASPGVSSELFGAINEAGVVFNGRIVVNGAFETSAPCVFAGGDAAGFGRRHGDRPRFACCNAVEVGEALAASVERAVLGRGSGGEDAPAPEMGAARCAGGCLPGGMHYCRAALPHVWARRDTGAAEASDRRSLSTETEASGYVRLDVDVNGLIEALTYCGKAEPEGASLARVVGLNISFLGGLAEKYDAGEVSDLLEYFKTPWMAALFEDGFRRTLAKMRAAMPYGADMAPEERVAAGKAVVQKEILRLLKDSEGLAPYSLPVYA